MTNVEEGKSFWNNGKKIGSKFLSLLEHLFDFLNTLILLNIH